MILTKAQATNIYSSMLLANNLGGRIRVEIGDLGRTPFVSLATLDTGHIEICGDSDRFSVPAARELYESQAAFADAYGILR